jgi:hypothetical protein
MKPLKLTPAIKKTIAQYGEEACLFALEVHESGEGALESEYQTCNKFDIPFEPSPRNQHLNGDRMCTAGKFIKMNRNI